MEVGATAAVVARITVAAAFGWSAATKLSDVPAFARGLADFGVPASQVVARVLPVLEGGLAILLVAVREPAWPAWLAIALLTVFTGAVIVNLLGDAPAPCPCFGPPGAGARPVSAATVARNGYLVALAVIGTGSTEGASTAAALGVAVLTVAATLVALRRYG